MGWRRTAPSSSSMAPGSAGPEERPRTPSKQWRMTSINFLLRLRSRDSTCSARECFSMHDSPSPYINEGHRLAGQIAAEAEMPYDQGLRQMPKIRHLLMPSASGSWGWASKSNGLPVGPNLAVVDLSKFGEGP